MRLKRSPPWTNSVTKNILKSFWKECSSLTSQGLSSTSKTRCSCLIISALSVSMMVFFLIIFMANVLSVLMFWTKYTFAKVPCPISDFSSKSFSKTPSCLVKSIWQSSTLRFFYIFSWFCYSLLVSRNSLSYLSDWAIFLTEMISSVLDSYAIV